MVRNMLFWHETSSEIEKSWNIEFWKIFKILSQASSVTGVFCIVEKSNIFWKFWPPCIKIRNRKSSVLRQGVGRYWEEELEFLCFNMGEILSYVIDHQVVRKGISCFKAGWIWVNKIDVRKQRWIWQRFQTHSAREDEFEFMN